MMHFCIYIFQSQLKEWVWVWSVVTHALHGRRAVHFAAGKVSQSVSVRGCSDKPQPGFRRGTSGEGWTRRYL